MRFVLKLILLCWVLTLMVGQLCLAQEPPPPSNQPPANVAGKWTVYANDPNGQTSTKYFDLKQQGEKLTGKFKGPNASGGIEGTIQERHIVIRTKTRHPLTFRGRVEGERVDGVIQGAKIEGKFHAPKGVGTFQAVRSQ